MEGATRPKLRLNKTLELMCCFNPPSLDIVWALGFEDPNQDSHMDPSVST